MLTEQKKIGELIRAKRKEKHLTQAQLSEKLDITRDAVFTYEKGKVKVIPFDKRVKLAAVLDIPISKLLYSNELNLSYSKPEDEFKIEDMLDALTESEMDNIHSRKITLFEDLCFNLPVERKKTLEKLIAGTEKLSFSNAAYYVFVSAKSENMDNIANIICYMLRKRGLASYDAEPLAQVFQCLYTQYLYTPNGENIKFMQEMHRDYWNYENPDTKK